MAKGGRKGKHHGAASGAGGEIMRQAARLQRQIDERRKELKDQEVSATGAADAISVTVTCEGRVRQITVDPAFLESEGLEMTLDVVVATVNAALEQADATSQRELDKLTGGLRIPGVTG